jgi:acyl-CoA synthetase (AMP-forming)/AMP-acid ligase II
LAACGRKTPFVNIQIMDDQGRLLPAGKVGEIVVRSQGVMLGYYKSPVLTAEVSEYGWHHTGDVGYRDDDGFFYIVDRKKDMIISGGFNVYSAEVERVVLAHPSVKDCAVIGVPDAKWGEAVKAVVELKEGAKANAEEIIAHCKAQIGSMKSPKSVDFLEVLPRSGVGKVLKREIRKTYWAGRERQV